ncbi:DNA-binding transcriptional LysR family regulator [Lysinibacillus composti]|uniref:LysR family transcriptional regulator n=1 Tax=Lysinibacillus composti TaxID=720633 RepID=A0A3N9UNU2_9BACI|nr:LysR family transcriptional regulator [Lysinibacillus composti]MBM7609802.1 DNA-binding transcriptional LysR family regulator [Lysinibacillus composti]RQW73576.1 LysR family transcriptional regulator [Lysinibacillus composti]
MELRNLKTFQVVAKELNMTKAAQILMYTQPTVTTHIQSLEKELNQTLFMRSSGNKISLTPAGKTLKIHSDKIFETIEDLHNELSILSGPSGILTIAASEYYSVHYLSHFFKVYSNIYPEVKLRFIQANSIEATEKVLNSDADLGIAAIQDNSTLLEHEILDFERLVLVVSSSIYNKDNSLNDYPFLSYSPNSSFDCHINKAFQTLQYTPSATIECGSSEEMIRRAVLNGTGIGFLGEKGILEEINSKKLIPLYYCTKPILNTAIYLKSNQRNVTIQSFIDVLKGYWLDIAPNNNFE